MPVAPTYPGVYVEEIPSGVHSITGVATSIAAFVDYFPLGPLNEAVQIFSWADFERQFGGLDSKSEASYAIQQFFLNGGTQAYVVRTTTTSLGKSAVAAAIGLQNTGTGGTPVLVATAVSPGQWGNQLRIDIDYGTTDPTTLFNLTVTKISLTGAQQVQATETFRNLSMDKTQPNYAVALVTGSSQLIELDLVAAARPAQTGTTSNSFTLLGPPLPTWSAGHNYSVGDMILDTNQNVEVVITAGKSDAAAPKWKTVVGTPISDGTVTWKLLPTGAGLTFPAWSSNQSYPVGAQIIDPNGNLQKVTTGGVSGPNPPSWSTDFSKLNTTDGTVTWNLVFPSRLVINQGDQMTVSLNTQSALTKAIVINWTDPSVISWGWLAATLQSQLQGVHPCLVNATVTLVGSASTQVYLQFKSGTSNQADYLTFAGQLASDLGITSALANVQQYALGASTAVQAQAFPPPGGTAQPGSDGVWDPVSDSQGIAGGLIGKQADKTGMYALLDVDIFNILCIPATTLLPDNAAGQVATNATSLCTLRRAFYILDAPQQAKNRDTPDGINSWLDQNAALRNRNAALYFPRLDIADPANGFRSREVSPSGTIAGLYARTDAARGVWKAPAGTAANLAGIQGLEYKVTDGENGVLNPLAINCLRVFPVFGPVCWGARTLFGADQQADDYKYIPVRRLALFLEESLYRGLKWVVFEPNDEPLWTQIRLNVGAFMHDLFRQGAFQGSAPKDAYFVKCDKETTTQNDINLGIVNIVVGFAPLKPAEFVIIQLQQMAGQIQV